MRQTKIRIFGGAAVVLLLATSGFGQAPGSAPQPADPAPPQLLTGPQLENLVAPVALYPDPLLSQVLAASTYPLEMVEAGQWLPQNRNLRGQQLMDAAKQMNWDPSVQAMVAFPDAMTLLTRDIRWTTDLGNAFLTQQADVMNAVQRMRARARDNGRLANTPQQVVTSTRQDGETAIEIQPADPQVVYVPTYNPVYVWGPPVWGAYPGLYYPPIGFGFGFGPACYLGGFFPGFVGFGGWGWGFGWFGHSLFANSLFFNHYGFHGYGGFRGGFGGYGGRAAWAHNPEHRLGVSYPNRAVANRFGGNGVRGGGNGSRGGPAGGWRSFQGGSRMSGASPGGLGAGAYRGGSSGFQRSDGSRGFSSPRGSSNSGSSYRGGGYPGGGARGSQSFAQGTRPSQGFAGSAPRNYSSQGFGGRSQGSAPRNYSAPQRFSAPSQHYSAPQHFSAPSQHYSAPRSSGFSGGGRSSGSSSSGGHSGGHTSGGGSRGR